MFVKVVQTLFCLYLTAAVEVPLCDAVCKTVAGHVYVQCVVYMDNRGLCCVVCSLADITRVQCNKVAKVSSPKGIFAVVCPSPTLYW